MTGARWREEAGFAGGFDALAFGVLIFVVGTLLIVNAWAAIDAKFAVSSAAREAVRAAVETPATEEPGPRAAAAAREVLAGHGLDPDRATVVAEQVGLARCQEVVYRVSTRVPILVLPGLERRRDGFTVSARHTEVVDPYRSGLELGDSCGF